MQSVQSSLRAVDEVKHLIEHAWCWVMTYSFGSSLLDTTSFSHVLLIISVISCHQILPIHILLTPILVRVSAHLSHPICTLSSPSPIPSLTPHPYPYYFPPPPSLLYFNFSPTPHLNYTHIRNTQRPSWEDRHFAQKYSRSVLLNLTDTECYSDADIADGAQCIFCGSSGVVLSGWSSHCSEGSNSKCSTTRGERSCVCCT